MMRLIKLIFFSASFNIVINLESGISLDFKSHDNKALEEILRNFSSITHDRIHANIYSIGKSTAIFDIKSENLWVLEITAVRNSTGIPNVKLISGVFGDEHVGTEILLHFIDHLITSYGNDKSVTYLLDNTRIHILARMNPSGYPNNRRNPKQFVLDEIFPDVFRGEDRNQEPQLESEAVRKWLNNTHFVLSATLSCHSSTKYDSNMIIYPYSSVKMMGQQKKPSLTSDHNIFKHLANVYQNNHQNGEHEQFLIRNGAMMKRRIGTMQDYNYFKHGCMELDIKIKEPEKAFNVTIHQLFEENKKALIEYCLQANQGIFGLVRDSATKKPIQARFKINGTNMEFETNTAGECWKILLPGIYEIEVLAQGYYKKTQTFQVDSAAPLPKLKHLEVLLDSDKVVTTTTESENFYLFGSTTNTMEVQHISEISGPKIGARIGSANQHGVYAILLLLSTFVGFLFHY